MVHYDGDTTVQDQGRDARLGRDPGDILQEAIDLWCYFLKLESDPLAYRWGESDHLPHPASSRQDTENAGATAARGA